MPSSPCATLCIAGRYVLRGVIGRGGHGEVWEADDTLAQTLVAVKLLRSNAIVEPARVRREVSALRLLRIPGVVQMLDEGMDGGTPFLVMERVSGLPFPAATERSWSTIAPATLALLETLERVHAAGVVHRDIKPGNVLVDEHGRPTLLDFGLSLGPSLARDSTGNGHIVGTPEYIAPEQIVGETMTPATDLYAVGVMLYEALSGRLPHETNDFQTLMRLRLMAPPPRLGDVAPAVPVAIANAIDSLLARAPHERPQSAGELIDRLRDPSSRSWLPRGALYGDRFAVETLVAAARQKRSVDLVGIRGTGRTRTLQEVAAQLADEGIDAVWTVPGKRPFSSLIHVITALEDPNRRDLDAVDQALAEVLEMGRVIFADDESRLDRHSRAALERARSFGTVIRVIESASEHADIRRHDVVALGYWHEAQLRELFVGPDRVFHLREDAAHELHVRSQGLPSRIFGELASWERAGLAQKVGPTWMVSREALDRLAAGRVALPLPPAPSTDALPAKVPQHLEELATWVELSWPHTSIEALSRIMEQPCSRIEAEMDELAKCGAIVRSPDGRAMVRVRQISSSRRNTERRRSAHRAIGRALTRGAEGRLFHLIASQSECEAMDPTEIVAETLALTEPLVLQGLLGRATALLTDGLLAARQGTVQGVDWGESRLLGWLVDVAISDGSPRALDAAHYELCRVTNRTPEIEALERLVRAALAMRTTAGDRAISLVDGISPFANPNLERRRQQLRVQSARRCSLDREQAVLAEAEVWARGTGEYAGASISGWLGRLRYREGRFDEAAELHAKAAAGERWTTERLAAHLNCASALLEAFRFDEAVVVANEARQHSASCRHAYGEARAEWLIRTARYRRGDSLDPDEEFVELAAKTGVVDLEALASLTEAAIAWRRRDMDRTVALSRRTEERWTTMGKTWGALFARTLAIAAHGTTTEDWNGLIEAATQCPVSGAGIQMLGLLAHCRPETAAELLPTTLAFRSAIPERFWRLRMDVLSVDEACAFVANRST